MAANKSGKVISIAINNEYVKIAELSKSKKEVMVHRIVTVATPYDSYDDGVIKDMKRMGTVIRQVLDDNRMTTDSVVFSVSSTKVATKEVVIPYVKEKKIHGIIQMNASEYFPVDIDRYLFQHIVINKQETDGAQELKLLVMAAPSDMIEDYYELSETLNLKVQAIDYSGNSSMQLLKHQIKAGSSVIIQIENDSTTVSIFENGILQIQRIVPYGKSILVTEVMSQFGLNYENALKKLQEEKLVRSRLGNDPITDSLSYLVRNVNRVVDYYTSRNSNKALDNAYMIGNITTIGGFVGLFTNELGMNMEAIDHLYGVSKDKKTYVQEENIPNYVNNIGALLSPVNFVPLKVQQKVQKSDTSKYYKLLLALSVAGAIAMVSTPLSSMLSAKAERDILQRSIDKLADVELVVNEYNLAKDRVDDLSKFKVLTSNNDDSLQDFVDVLEKKMPSDMMLTSMTVASGAVTIQGTAGSKSSVAKLIQQLQSESFISDVKVSNETENKNNAGAIEATFSLTCSFTKIEE